MGFDKYGSDGHLYVPGVSEICVPNSMEESVEALRNSLIQLFKPVIDMCTQVIQNLMDVCFPQIARSIEEFVRLYDLILESYPNKRIVWLALHHKKERVRKKNRKRIQKWIEKNMKT